MKLTSLARACSLTLLALAAAPALPAQVDGERHRGEGSGALTFAPIIAPAQPVQADAARIWKDLAGAYQTRTPGGELRLVLRQTSPGVLFAETTGELDGEKLFERGYFHIYGFQNGSRREVAIDYRPETFGRRFTCGFVGTPQADGFQVETNGSDCSFPLRRSVSQWKLEARGGEILVTDKKTGDLTRLVRVPVS